MSHTGDRQVYTVAVDLHENEPSKSAPDVYIWDIWQLGGGGLGGGLPFKCSDNFFPNLITTLIVLIKMGKLKESDREAEIRMHKKMRKWVMNDKDVVQRQLEEQKWERTDLYLLVKSQQKERKEPILVKEKKV